MPFFSRREGVAGTSSLQHRDIFQRNVSHAIERYTIALTHDSGIDYGNVLHIVVRADGILCERNHFIMRNRTRSTIHDLEAIFLGPSGDLLEDVLGRTERAADQTSLDEYPIHCVKVEAVPECLHVHPASDERGVVAMFDAEAGVLVDETVVRTPFTVIVGVAVGERTANNKSAVKEGVAIVADMEFILRNPVVRIRLVGDVSEIASFEGIVGAVDVPRRGDMGSHGEFALGGNGCFKDNSAQVEAIV